MAGKKKRRSAEERADSGENDRHCGYTGGRLCGAPQPRGTPESNGDDRQDHSSSLVVEGAQLRVIRSR
jgi:hypothetical protein